MGYSEWMATPIIMSLIVIAVALYLTRLGTFADKPTLGDILIDAALHYGVPVSVILGFIWWAVL